MSAIKILRYKQGQSWSVLVSHSKHQIKCIDAKHQCVDLQTIKDHIAVKMQLESRICPD